jgi:inosose dehydratase
MVTQKSHAGGIQIGCQTNAWPVNPVRPATFFDSLEQISQLGFNGFETGFRNIMPLANSATQLSTAKQDLTFFGVHIFLHEYDVDTRLPPLDLVMEVAAVAARLGAERVILSGGPANFQALPLKVKALNEIGVRLRSLGLSLAYHNHGPEFRAPEPEIDTLLSGTDPALVSFVLDAGHAFGASIDLPAFIARHSDRLTGIHLRDFKDGQQVPLGRGNFPLEHVSKALKEKNWSGWILVEEEREDGSKPGLSAAKPAREALRQAFGT